MSLSLLSPLPLAWLCLCPAHPSLFFPALEVGGSASGESPPLSLLGAGSCSLFTVRELGEERAGKPQGRDAQPGLEGGVGVGDKEVVEAFYAKSRVGRTMEKSRRQLSSLWAS